MSELSELYQEVILDHNRRPKNFGALADATAHAHGDNPLCGDTVDVYLHVTADRIDAITFQGSGCAISKASASMMTEAVRGRTLAEAALLFERFHHLLTSPLDAPVDDEAVGKLAVFAGVREFPMRVKCATLAWHTLKRALAASAGRVT